MIIHKIVSLRLSDSVTTFFQLNAPHSNNFLILGVRSLKPCYPLLSGNPRPVASFIKLFATVIYSIRKKL